MAYRRPLKKTEQLNLRVTPEEKERIRAAAEALDITVTELMVQSTMERINGASHRFVGTLRRMRELGKI